MQQGIAHAVGNSLHEVFLVAAPIAFAGFVIVTLLREQPLRGRDGGVTESLSAGLEAARERAAWQPEQPKGRRKENEPCQSSTQPPSRLAT